MILMSGFALGQLPFRDIYLHGIIRDAQGRKFSKSLGNGIDPVVMVDTFGADAVRMSLLIGNTPGTDMRLSEDKIKGYRHFANKLWNITRFIFENTEEYSPDAPVTEEDAALRDAVSKLADDVSQDIEAYRLYMAAEKMYHYVWHELADVILESSKPILMGDDVLAKKSRQATLRHLLETVLVCLHPFMPYVTEEIWQSMPQKRTDFLMITPWPTTPNANL